MVKAIRIYVEGGGKGKNASAKITLQQGFNNFFREVRDLASSKKIHWHLITCGSRDETHKDFMRSVQAYPESFSVLLVDSETEVNENKSSLEHLRENDGWNLEDVEDEQCQLMVQVMEAWFIADVDSLKDYYGKDFKVSSLPKTADVEKISKLTIEQSLKKATRKTPKREYHKIKHGAELLEKIDSRKVRLKATHCEQLFATLESKIDE